MISSVDQHTSSYDFDLQLEILHFSNYPQMLPFIGKNWKLQKDRILFIGESHYLSHESVAENNSLTWYSNNATSLSENDRKNINTRNVINSADHRWLDSKQYCKAHTIFYNLKSAILDSQKVADKNKYIFDRLGFYNYFQRPAEVTGDSIINLYDDDQVAYKTLEIVASKIKPTIIFFLSKRAFYSFNTLKTSGTDTPLNDIAIYSIQHPSSPWWYRKIKAYNGISAHDQFVKIISELDLNLK